LDCQPKKAIECFPQNISRAFIGHRIISAPSPQHSSTELVSARGRRALSNTNEGD
jgi:hypothetical protein